MINILEYDPPGLKPHLPDRWDHDTWIVTRKGRIVFEYNSHVYRLVWQRGFVTDGGSVPRIAWRVIGGLASSVSNARANVAVWLQQHWPLWRHVFEMEGQIVAQSEFTVSETVSGKAFMTGCLMGAGFTPNPAWKERTPSTDKYAVEGLVYLP